ncbi:MAG: M14 family metallocarboxypeptidase [Colwellia sp.]|nr:M14 family metallocarboxypeptidase [Colwellia sp.]MCW8866031.1 M14 family metallocarboxypeptidase [Colwellia sp.]MCW9081638.1 M14 family metallocarboxypeptidase [Colwellia sp.]
MTDNPNCSIGTPGKKWTDTEKQQWFEQQTIKRSYQDEVVNKINALSSFYDVIQYGALTIDEPRYPLFSLKSKNWQADRKTVLVTGGVHGYETSGVQGALRFLKNEADGQVSHYSDAFNILVVPCVSPWGYETINRWNHKALDPNRSFYADSPAQESAALMAFISSLEVEIFVHVDLHETTDTDNSVFRPALSARDAIEQKAWDIPDGFYLVGNTLNPQAEFQLAIINEVAKVTHIAPADEDGKLIGVELEQFGVINYAGRELGLCMGLTDANYVTTTEVYPDSPKVDDENCIVAQVAAVTGALDYILSKNNQ